MPVLMRPSLHDAQLVGDRGFPLVVGTEASVKRESHEGSTGSRSTTVQIRCDFPLFSTILKRLGLLSTYLRKHRISVSNVGRARFELCRPLYLCLLGMIYLSTIDWMRISQIGIFQIGMYHPEEDLGRGSRQWGGVCIPRDTSTCSRACERLDVKWSSPRSRSHAGCGVLNRTFQSVNPEKDGLT